MTQYQRELQKVIEEGGDVKKFKDEWLQRAVDCYRENVKTKEDIHKFRCGGFKI